MIIDTRTHIWASLDQLGREMADALRSRAAVRNEHLESAVSRIDADMGCVDGAFVFGFRSDRLGARVPNEFIAEFVSQNPRRFIGIGGIDPMAGDSLDQIESGQRLGLAGFTVSPASQGFHPAHSSAMRVYERCNEIGVPLFVTMMEPLTPTAALEFARPALWDEVAQAFPNLPIVIGQLGHPWVDETLVMLAKHRNLLADISGVASRPWQLYNTLLSASSMGVMDKLLFGSGFPFDTPESAIEAIYSVNAYCHGTQLPSVPRSQIRAIVERDSLALLGIETVIAARQSDGSVRETPTVTMEFTDVLQRRGVR